MTNLLKRGVSLQKSLMNQYVIQSGPFNERDIRQAVAVHRTEIGQGFLSSLGDSTLKLIFSSAANSQSGILLLVKSRPNDEVCGFLLGTTETGKFYKEFLFRKSLRAMLILSPKLLSVIRIRKIVETLLYPIRQVNQNHPNAELLDIAVLKEFQGSGLAQRLFYDFVDILRQRNVNAFRITTGENLIRAQRFYEKLGARKVITIEIHKGQKAYVYTYQIPSKD